MWLFPILSIPQSNDAPYISSKVILISSEVGIVLDPLLNTEEINACFVMFSFTNGVVINTDNKFVLNLFVFIV